MVALTTGGVFFYNELKLYFIVLRSKPFLAFNSSQPNCIFCCFRRKMCIYSNLQQRWFSFLFSPTFDRILFAKLQTRGAQFWNVDYQGQQCHHRVQRCRVAARGMTEHRLFCKRLDPDPSARAKDFDTLVHKALIRQRKNAFCDCTIAELFWEPSIKRLSHICTMMSLWQADVMNKKKGKTSHATLYGSLFCVNAQQKVHKSTSEA